MIITPRTPFVPFFSEFLAPSTKMLVSMALKRYPLPEHARSKESNWTPTA